MLYYLALFVKNWRSVNARIGQFRFNFFVALMSFELPSFARFSEKKSVDSTETKLLRSCGLLTIPIVG